MPRFSSDGTKVIFQSHGRATHKSAQIYVLNLTSKKEHRVTYNDGDDFSPAFAPNGRHILYSSTTDEIKEHPDGTSNGLLQFNPAEIRDPKEVFEELYLSEPDGSHISRLTRSVGFDGQADFSTNGWQIIFVSSRNGTSNFYITDLKGKNPRPIFENQDSISSPRFSPNGKLIAFETKAKSEDKKTPVQIALINSIGKNFKQLTNQGSINRDPSWTPDGKQIIFSSNREGINTYFIYVMNADGTCLKRISPPPELKSKTDLTADIYPSISPDGKKLLFSSNRSGTFQLYLVDFTQPTECLAETP